MESAASKLAVPVESGLQPQVGPLPPGSPAPGFVLPDADMDSFDLGVEASRHIIVLCFYPRDGTPVCTRQAIEFSDHDQAFSDQGAIVVGVSPDDCLTHAAFRDEHGLSIRLLSDEDGEVSRLYGVWEQGDGGRARVRRAVFVIDRQCHIQQAYLDINAHGFATEVLKQIRKLARKPHGNRQEHGRDA